MDPLYLTRKEICQVLSMSENQARAILLEHGVQPVDLGKGRKRGLRWRTSAVIRVADILHVQAQKAPKKSRKRQLSCEPGLLKGRPVKEIFEEFNLGNMQ